MESTMQVSGRVSCDGLDNSLIVAVAADRILNFILNSALDITLGLESNGKTGLLCLAR